MTDRGVEEKPSETALFAALRRAIAHKEYQNDRLGPDYLADIFPDAYIADGMVQEDGKKACRKTEPDEKNQHRSYYKT